ncbi:MAG: hypothetical protein OXC42_05455 [Gammaproteobacteria bacterium]|nr:hypothetical protein [Gammaproteobacteria bacterium]
MANLVRLGHSNYFLEKHVNMTRCIETDECLDVLASLEHCALSLRQAQQSDRAWKWVVLSLHSALQGAMVCHLSGTTEEGALTTKCVKEWFEWHEKDRRGEISRVQEGVDELGIPTMRIARKEDNPPQDIVASASELFGRLSCPSKRIESSCGAIIKTTERQQTAFTRLHNLRNKFTHFSPKGWSIELEYIEETIEDILGVICLIQDDPWPFRDMAEESMSALYSTIEEIRSILAHRATQK